MIITATTSLEIELLITADYLPPISERGPTYDCGGEPAEPASVENVTVDGLFSLRRISKGDQRGWASDTLLDGVDVKSPDIQRLFENLLKAAGEDAEAALIAEVIE